MKKLTALLLLLAFLIPVSVFAANDGISHGGLTFGDAKYGTASASFNGIDAYIEVPHSSSLDFSGDFTFELWVKTNAAYGEIITKASDSEEAGFTIANNGGGGYPWFYAYSSLAYIDFGAVVQIGDGNWHHLCVRRFSDIFSIYVDSVLSNETTVNIGSLANSEIMTFGHTYIGWGIGIWFNGLIDEIAYFNVALSPETIASHYNSTNYQADVSGTSGLVSYWRFDNDFLDAPLPSGPLTELELLQQIKDALDQIDAKTQAIQEVTAGSTAVDWNKTMSFVVGTLSSLAFVFASRMIL